MLAQQFKTFLEREISIESGTIQRPTVFERRVQVFSSFLLSLEDYISIDANHIITSALLSMTQRAYFETPDLLAWAEGIASDESADSSKAGQLKVIDMIADFYTYFVEWRLPLGAALYSPSKRCFVSQAAFNAEQYCSIGYARFTVWHATHCSNANSSLSLSLSLSPAHTVCTAS